MNVAYNFFSFKMFTYKNKEKGNELRIHLIIYFKLITKNDSVSFGVILSLIILLPAPPLFLSYIGSVSIYRGRFYI